MPFRVLPLLFFGAFALLWILTEHVGQRVYAPADYDPQVLSRSLYFVAIGIGFARRGIWFWRFCLLAWPIQLFAVGVFATTMPAGRDLGADADLTVYSTTEVALIVVQVAMLAAMLACLLLPCSRAALSRDTPGGLFDEVVLCVFVLLGISFVGLRGAEAERVVAAAAAIADGLAAEAMQASAALIGDGPLADLAAPLAATCRPARHVLAAAATIGPPAMHQTRAVTRTAKTWSDAAADAAAAEKRALAWPQIAARSQAATT